MSLRLLVAAPGSGKTTWCTRHQARLGWVLSLDRTRSLLGAGEHDQTVNPLVVAEVADRMDWLLANEKTVTLDATSSSILDRARWLEIAHRYRAPVLAVVLRVPLETCLYRNARRSRQVPPEVVAQMWQRIDRTTAGELLAEGFRAVTEIVEQDSRRARTRLSR